MIFNKEGDLKSQEVLSQFNPKFKKIFDELLKKQ
jgi:hypothetical protein